jgi:lipoyl(octanoyl) transferase
VRVKVVELGRLPYAAAYRVQCEHVEEVLAAREAGRPEPGRILVVEHDPVITVSSRPTAPGHLLASPERLTNLGVAVERTDRGGDITYHGPGQVVIYPILDLNLLNLGLHAYMRVLEEAVIAVCRALGVDAQRDTSATGVWVARSDASDAAGGAKVCAMGVRVRRWVSMHGLALNVRTNLEHFGLIVPCGLHGRTVTSLERELGGACPPTPEVAGMLTRELSDRIAAAMREAEAARSGAASASRERAAAAATEPAG